MCVFYGVYCYQLTDCMMLISQRSLLTTESNRMSRALATSGGRAVVTGPAMAGDTEP